MKIPVVYNTNAYEKVETLKLLDGLIDIYLPDLKYVSDTLSQKYSGAKDYFSFASGAVLEMHRQVGGLDIKEGIATKGLLIRHLVLPACLDDTRQVLDWISDKLGTRTYISLMSQYTPMHRAFEYPDLSRTLTRREYSRATDYCLSLGFENVFIQDMSSASSIFTPAFKA